MRIRVVDHVVADRHRPRHRQPGPERDRPLLDRGRRGDDLVGGARFVGVGDGAVAERRARRVRERVRVEPRVAHHRQDLACPGVHHDHGAPAGALLLHRLLERRLRLELEVAVDRRDDRGSGDRRKLLVDPAHDRLARKAELVRLLPRRARQHVLVPELEPGQTDAIGAHEPEHLGRERTRGVGAPRGGQQADAGEVEPLDPVGGIATQLPGEVDERAVGGHRVDEVRHADPEQR